VKLCLLLHWCREFVSGGEPERSRPKIYVSRAWAEVEKNEREVAEWARSGERRSQKWAFTLSGKTARSTLLQIPMLCTGVIEWMLKKITNSILYIRLFTQTAVREYNNQTILSDLLERFSVSVLPVTNNIYRSAVPAPNYLPEWRSAAFRHHYSPEVVYLFDDGTTSGRNCSY